jgi:hypothetical protein
MPHTFTDGASARKLPDMPAAVGSRPRLLALCPASFSIEDAWAFKDAAERDGYSLSIYRTADEFRLSDVVSDIRNTERPVTHLLLILGQLSSYDDIVLREADRADIPHVSVYCLHYVDSLQRHVARLDAGKIRSIVVRTPAEEAQVKRRWDRIPVRIAEDVQESAGVVLRHLFESSQAQASAMAK